ITRAPGQSWRQRAGYNPAARGGFQNGAWRQGRRASCNIRGVRLENQRHHIAVVVFRNRAGEHLVSFQHGLSPVTHLMARMITIGLSAVGHSATCGGVRAMSVLTNSRHWMRRVYEYTALS